MTRTDYSYKRMKEGRRMLVCDANHSNITIQSGAAQWMAGDVKIANEYKKPTVYNRSALNK